MTPGPWHVDTVRWNLEEDIPIRGPGGVLLASVVDGEEGLANAHLLAASPDLLAVAERLAVLKARHQKNAACDHRNRSSFFVPCEGCGGPVRESEWLEVATAAEAAIAKARVP